MARHDAPAWASGVCAGIHGAGSRDVVYVPDNPLSHVLRVFEEQVQESAPTVKPPLDYVAIKERFMAAL